MSIGKVKLKVLAETATCGPWRLVRDGIKRIESENEFVCEAGGLEDRDAEFIAAANPATVLELIAENRGQAKKIKWDESWYGARFETLFHWVHRELNEEQKTQYFNIVANGSSGPLDPPTYAQQMNQLKWKVEVAEKERDMLQAEVARSTEREILQLAEIESLLKKVGRARVVAIPSKTDPKYWESFEDIDGGPVFNGAAYAADILRALKADGITVSEVAPG